jgi:ubiquitin carboxyl-terminal hydrolase 2/21
MNFTLDNLGNTCYFNTAIQCMFSSEKFITSLYNSESEELIVKLFRNMIQRIISDSKKDTLNQILKNVIVYMNHEIKIMELFEQNDLCEFVMCWFDLLHKATKVDYDENKHSTHDIIQRVTRSSMNDKMIKLSDLCERHMKKEYKKTKYSFVCKELNSMIISQIKCGCGKLWTNYELHNHLQLDIHNKLDIYECIESYVKSIYFNDPAEEHTTEWTCDSCKQKHKSKKSIAFWNLANTFVIFLKRFNMVADGSNANGFRFVKDNTNIEIPTLLDMSPFVINARYTNNKFKLLSVGCHIGRMNGGHYYSVLRDQIKEENGEPNVWRVADDESSVSIKEEEGDRDRFRQHLKHAYMLVYSKV